MTRALTADRETSILDAAQRRFAHFGISKVTMDEIAADVGLGKASLYYYFPAKEDLFRAVLQREERGYLDALRVIMDREVSPAEKLKLFARKRLELFTAFLNLAQFKLDSWKAMHPAFQKLFHSLEAEERRFLTTILQHGIKQGDFAIRDPQRVATLILHVLHGLRLRVVQNSRTPMEADANTTELSHEVEHLFDMLLAGILNKKRTHHQHS